MLNKQLVTEKKEKMDYEPILPDVYQVELFDITEKQAPNYNDKTKMETVLNFQFVLLEGIGKDLKSLRGRNIWRNFVPNYFYEGNKGKNVTLQIVEAILERGLTATEEAYWDGEDWNNLIGRQLRVLIENTTKGDKTYNNIKSFLPTKNEMEPLTAEEKEKATVKKKEETPEVNPGVVTEGIDEEINIDEINKTL